MKIAPGHRRQTDDREHFHLHCSALEGGAVFEGKGQATIRVGRGVNYDSNRHCLLRMIALSWKWTAMLFSGEVSSVSQLARRVGFSASYVTKIISLFNLAPSIVEDIVNGRIPDGLSLAQMQNLPDDWQEQCRLLGFSFRPTGI